VSETQKSPATTLILVGLLVATIAVVFAMFVNWIGVYLEIWGGTPTVTQGAIVGYQVLAGIAIALTVGGMVLGFARRRVGFGISHVVLLLVVLLAATVFAVPRYSAPVPREHQLPSNYVPCFSGSNDCPGG
jgi:hypothetical protein